MASTPTKLANDEAKNRWNLVKDTFRLEEALAELGINYTRIGHELQASCPMPSHGGEDRNPSWSINDQSFSHNCFSCTGGGGPPQLVMAIHGCSFVEAVDWLCQFTDRRNPEGIAYAKRMLEILSQRHGEPIPRKRPTLPWMPMSALDHFTQPTDYFASRGISDEACQILHLGFDAKHKRKDYYGPAAIIPHIFRGELVGWQVRWIRDDRPNWIPKYTNSEDFPKESTLYNYDRVADNTDAVVVVESALTVAKLLTAGIPAVATFGGSATPQQLRLLSGFRQGLILAFDNDDTGDSATRAIGDVLNRHVSVTVLPPPPGEKADLGDLTVDEIHAKMTDTRPYLLWRSGL